MSVKSAIAAGGSLGNTLGGMFMPMMLGPTADQRMATQLHQARMDEYGRKAMEWELKKEEERRKRAAQESLAGAFGNQMAASNEVAQWQQAMGAPLPQGMQGPALEAPTAMQQQDLAALQQAQRGVTAAQGQMAAVDPTAAKGFSDAMAAQQGVSAQNATQMALLQGGPGAQRAIATAALQNNPELAIKNREDVAALVGGGPRQFQFAGTSMGAQANNMAVDLLNVNPQQRTQQHVSRYQQAFNAMARSSMKQVMQNGRPTWVEVTIPPEGMPTPQEYANGATLQTLSQSITSPAATPAATPAAGGAGAGSGEALIQGDKKPLSAEAARMIYQAGRNVTGVEAANQLIGYNPETGELNPQGYRPKLTSEVMADVAPSIHPYFAGKNDEIWQAIKFNVTEPALRISSGAATPDAETKRYFMNLMPKPGEDEETVKFKMAVLNKEAAALALTAKQMGFSDPNEMIQMFGKGEAEFKMQMSTQLHTIRKTLGLPSKSDLLLGRGVPGQAGAQNNMPTEQSQQQMHSQSVQEAEYPIPDDPSKYDNLDDSVTEVYEVDENGNLVRVK